MKKSYVTIILACLVPVLLWRCGSDDGAATQSGKLIIQMTDAPFPTDLLEKAEITIDQIELRQGGGDGDPFLLLSDAVGTFNLLDLVNGITAELINMEVPVGEYDLIRLHITDASVELTDGTIFDMTVPSGTQSGLKLFVNPSLQVAGGLTSELLLDFDVSRSFIPQGNMDTPAGIEGFNFVPVIKVSNLSTAGRLAGKVTDVLADPLHGVTLSLFAGDTLNTSTFSDIAGDYAILGLTAGSYELVAEKEGFDTQTNENLEIVAANITAQNLEMVPE